MASNGYSNNAHTFAPSGNDSDWRIFACIGQKRTFATKQALLGQTYIFDRAIGAKPIYFIICVHHDGSIWTG